MRRIPRRNHTAREFALCLIIGAWTLGGCNLPPSVFSLVSPPSAQPEEKTSPSKSLPPKGPTSEGHYRGLAVGYLDGDGTPEIVAGRILTGEIVIWRGKRKGGWTEPVTLLVKSDIRKLDIADIDGDARLDIIMALKGGKSGIYIWKNLGNFKFRLSKGPGQGEVVEDLVAVDLNFDGRADLVVAKSVKGKEDGIRIWMNTGPDRWQPSPAPDATGPYLSVSVADLNKDGILDIVGARSGAGGGLFAWLGKDTPKRWGNPNVLARGDYRSASIHDMNGDGNLDLMATGRKIGIQIWQGLGKGNLNRMASPNSNGSFWRAVATDRDGDGLIDIVASTMDGRGIQMWRQAGEKGVGWVPQRVILPDRGIYRNLLVSDFDGDGRPDLGAATHGAGIPVCHVLGKSCYWRRALKENG